MKTFLSLPATVIILIYILFNGCSSSQQTVENRIEFIEKSEENNQVTLYKYKFNFESDAWMNITAYVKKEKTNYIISINGPAENNLNVSKYYSESDENNLVITNRVKPENAVSIEDAIKKSILFYLADNI